MKKVVVLNLSSSAIFAHIIGDAVLILLQGSRRVTIGNILDVLEHKKHSANEDDIDNLRNTINYLRNRAERS